MSRPIPSHDVVVVRQEDAEVVGIPAVTGRLYADSSATGGALSSQRITLRHGAAGATPHHHTGSSELFYVISGAAEMLTGERVLAATEGDLVVVPPGTVHAFAAAPDADADLLIILAPAWNGSSTSANCSASPPGRLRWRASCRPTTYMTTTSMTARSGSGCSQRACDHVRTGTGRACGWR